MNDADDEARAAIAVQVSQQGGAAVNILVVDSGIHAGLAIVLITATGAAPQLVDAIDIPIIGVGAKERVDVLALPARRPACCAGRTTSARNRRWPSKT
jgi:hypothetical protein